MKRIRWTALSVVAFGALSLMGGAASGQISRTHSPGNVSRTHYYWMGSWATSPAGLPTVSKSRAAWLPAVITMKGTIRYRIRLSLGGSQVRLRLSNEYGASTLGIAAVTVAMAGHGLDAVPGSVMPVTFGRRRSIAIPAGAPALSDPVALRVPSLGAGYRRMGKAIDLRLFN